MKRAFLTFALFIGVLAYSQQTTDIIKTDSGLFEATIYYENGKVEQTGFITSDKKNHGVWKLYDTKGNLKSIGVYDNGKKVGTWTFYNTVNDKASFTRVEFNDNSKIASVYRSDTDTKVAISELDEE